MRLTQQELNRYRKEVDRAADAAGSYVLDAMEAFLRVYPDADTAAMRNFVIEILQLSLPNFCNAAATLSADLFDEMAEALGVNVETKLYDTIDYGKVEQKIRYFAKFLNDGDADRFKGEVTDVTRYYVKRSAFENMIENCRGQKIKWARVPSGFETCAFCFMLASRGFVYGSEKKALVDHKSGDKYHKNCDCIVIPGFEDENGNPRVKIDGYDPEWMYEAWRSCAETVGSNDPAEIMKEVETRDWRWLYTGETPRITFENGAIEDEVRSKRAHELRTAERLNKHGVPTSFRADERYYFNTEKGVWQTVGLSDFANGYEIKTLKDAGWGSVDGYLRKVAKKEDVKAVVIDNFENKGALSDAELIANLKTQSRWDGPIYVLTRDGKYVLANKASASDGPLRVQPGRKKSITHEGTSVTLSDGNPRSVAKSLGSYADGGTIVVSGIAHEMKHGGIVSVKSGREFDENSFFTNTCAVYTPSKRPSGDPDFESGSGSRYWYRDGGVYRESDHWGSGVSSCNWFMEGRNEPVEIRGGQYGFKAEHGLSDDRIYNGDAVGFCRFSDFASNDDVLPTTAYMSFDDAVERMASDGYSYENYEWHKEGKRLRGKSEDEASDKHAKIIDASKTTVTYE